MTGATFVTHSVLEVPGIWETWIDPADTYKKFICNGADPITVFYTPETDGGGSQFVQEYVSLIKQEYNNRKFHKAFEWCSGTGFIGFSLLSHNVCSSLCLSESYHEAVDQAEFTIDHNRLDQSCVYLLKDLGLLPTHEQFDLVVANPPHFNKNIASVANSNRICSDVDWKSHKNFFSNIKSHLSSDGVILLLENSSASSVEDFRPMIEHGGLTVTNQFSSNVSPYYYIEIKSK